MKENELREAVREAIKVVEPKKEEKETYAPTDKEHLSNNKMKLNEELLRKWGLKKKDGKKLLNEDKK